MRCGWCTSMIMLRWEQPQSIDLGVRCQYGSCKGMRYGLCTSMLMLRWEQPRQQTWNAPPAWLMQRDANALWIVHFRDNAQMGAASDGSGHINRLWVVHFPDTAQMGASTDESSHMNKPGVRCQHGSCKGMTMQSLWGLHFHDNGSSHMNRPGVRCQYSKGLNALSSAW